MSPHDPLDKHSSTAQELKDLIAMEASGRPFLAWRDDARALKLRPLDPAHGSVSVGRVAGSDITLGWDSDISSVHAEVRPLGPEWTVVDDGISRNGTYVDGELVVGRKRLTDNARIRLGTTVLAFRAGDRAGAGPTTTLRGGTARRSDLSDNELSVLLALCEPMVLDPDEEPPTNQSIAAHARVFVGEEGVRRCLTRLFSYFEISEAPKRRRLAQKAIGYGIVRRSDYT